MSAGKKVLILDGNGIQVLVAAKLLEEFVHRSGKELDQLFDYIVGYSTGSLLAALLTVRGTDGKAKYNIDQIIDLLINRFQDIFYERSYFDQFMVTSYRGTKYSNFGLKNFLNETLGEARLNETTIPIVSASYSLENKSPRIWSSYKATDDESSNYYLKDMVLSVNTFNGYFPPEIIRLNHNRTIHDITSSSHSFGITIRNWGMGNLIKDLEEDSDNLGIISVFLGTNSFLIVNPIAEHIGYMTYIHEIIYHSIVVAFFTVVMRVKFMTEAVGITVVAIGVTGVIIGVIENVIKFVVETLFSLSIQPDYMELNAAELDFYSKKIALNPQLSKDYAEIDKTDPRYLEVFNRAIEVYIRHNLDGLITKTIQCLESGDYHSEPCVASRDISIKEVFDRIESPNIENLKKEYYASKGERPTTTENKDIEFDGGGWLGERYEEEDTNTQDDAGLQGQTPDTLNAEL